jgi:hypothetical protein
MPAGRRLIRLSLPFQVRFPFRLADVGILVGITKNGEETFLLLYFWERNYFYY